MAVAVTLPATLRTDADRTAIIETIDALVGRWPVERVILFGSKARGDDEPASDIDLLVITSAPVGRDDEDAMRDAAWDAGMRSGKVMQLVIRSHDTWWHGIDQATPLRLQIDADGIEVFAR
jgi:predicted nucleotidyltransferase